MTKKGAWEGQKKLQKVGVVPTIDAVRNNIMKIPHQRDRVFVALMYLTAGRVSEVISIEREYIQEGVRRKRDVLIIRMRNKKSRSRMWKDVIIPFDRETALVKDILVYKKGAGGSLFGFKTRQRGWQIIKQRMKCNPHWIRHLRLTHLVTVYDFNDQLLMRWAGWVSPKEARHYMELRVGDFLDKM